MKHTRELFIFENSPEFYPSFFTFQDHIRKGHLAQSDNIQELVLQAQSGSAFAQKLLYENHIQEMLVLSYRLLPDREDARDCIQESFISAFTKLKNLKDPEKFKPWLKRIVINTCLKRLNTKMLIPAIETAFDVEDDLQECSFINITSAEINKEINKLPSGCKQILTLYLFENYKHREIAQLLKISESTSKSQYQRALKLLRMKLKAYLT
ncbi:MAG: sigma-70 family RNA polymerase sigma factor [Bacteroidetes bacterium]|nr:sigma-70 family RNA polymerase sigma factor [Bacteroidota bacterium]MBT4412132.1 sigma-70 family RNA polymerase sigma factor [Bacteroidota bacterium]MBT7092148.1 sigma-70 family RNA polymerase sigma factor [Bacteroidota bacterium]